MRLRSLAGLGGLALVVTLLCGADGAPRFVLPDAPRFAPPETGVLFADDFSGDLARWTPDRPGVWSLEQGALRAELPDVKQQRSLAWAGDSTWKDYALDFDVCMPRGIDKGAVVRARGDLGIGIDVRGGTYQDVLAYVREWPIGRATALTADGAWTHVHIEVKGDRLRVAVNGVARLDRPIVRAKHGRIAMAAYTGGGGQCTVYYDNVIVTAL